MRFKILLTVAWILFASFVFYKSITETEKYEAKISKVQEEKESSFKYIKEYSDSLLTASYEYRRNGDKWRCDSLRGKAIEFDRMYRDLTRITKKKKVREFLDPYDLCPKADRYICIAIFILLLVISEIHTTKNPCLANIQIAIIPLAITAMSLDFFAVLCLLLLSDYIRSAIKKKY
jgi:hypothetical protein